MAVVFPDTSPRDVNVAKEDDEKYYLGSGAGYYLDATTDKWKQNFNMSSYILKDLPQIIE